MDEPKKVLTIHIGKNDIFEWTVGNGRDILIPELLVGCEELLYNDADEIHCLRVETEIRGNQKAFDFSIKKDGLNDTLNKIMDWGLETENYEICQRVKELFDYLKKDGF